MSQAIGEKNFQPVISVDTTPVPSTLNNCLDFLKKACKYILKAIAMIGTAYIGYKIGEKIYEYLSNRNQTQQESKQAESVQKNENADQHPPSKDLRFWILGKTGVGMSSLGNKILGSNVFKHAANATSTTVSVHAESKRINERHITVVDSPGMGITRNELEKSYGDIDSKSMQQVMADLLKGAFDFPNCQEGFDALLLVHRWNDRLTEENLGAIEEYKKIMGSDVFRKHGILVLTSGDNFKRKGITIDEWCKKDTGLQPLIKEVDGRYVLFDNVSTDPETINSQREQLIDQADKLRSKNKRYEKKEFQESVRKLPEAQLIRDIYTEIGDINDNISLWCRYKNPSLEKKISENIRQQQRKVQSITLNLEEKEKLVAQLDSMYDQLHPKPKGCFSFLSCLYDNA